MKDKELIEKLKDMQELRVFASEILQRGFENSITTRQEFDLLTRLKLSKVELTSLELSDKMELPKSNISRLVNALSKKGLIEKVKSEQDGRIYYLKLTDIGISELNKTYENYLSPLFEIENNLEEEQFNLLLNIIKELNINMRKEDEV